MSNFRFLLITLALISLTSCNTRIAELWPWPQEEAVEPYEQVELSTIEITDYSLDSDVDIELDPYQAAADRNFDLIHTYLDLSFDWEEERVIGTAQLTLSPHFYPSQTLLLDAINFKVLNVRDLKTGMSLDFDYLQQKDLKIFLNNQVTREDTIIIEIDYYAFPSQTGGSEAITSDKGLFFINSTGEEDKPQQIWTQGETENNSKWFPTLDKPNSRTSQEIKLTVQDRFVTLSNGLLINSKDNGNGTRTDHWYQKQSHAPYLFAVVVGEFEKVQDQWRDIDVDYYVEPEFKDYARAIFPYTIEMLDFFSEKLGVDYPWDKYAQVVVRDYVSGAMENTSAVIFGEFMYGTDRDLIDVDVNEKIVAHEMMHHWFGDLVTCESWANLTLNEGFANYSEYLWLEHKHGKGIADFHKMNEKEGYFSSLSYNMHPLIHYGYNDKEDMFDAHSYNKGGLVLHMLRHLVGDEAFFASCKKYLEDNAYTEVEIDELRLAFEEVTGLDLNWFFDQWFLSSGQPTLNVEKSYDNAKKTMTVGIRQVHSNEKMPAIFQLPIEIDFHFKDGSKQREKVFVNSLNSEFDFALTEEPVLTVIDPENVLLAIIQYNQSQAEYFKQLELSESFEHRLEAVRFLMAEGNLPARAVKLALKDDVWVIRRVALSQLNNPLQINIVVDMAKNDSHSEVRAAAINTLIRLGDDKHEALAKYVIEEEKAYNVISAAIEYLVFSGSPKAAEIASGLESSNSPAILLSVGKIYEESSQLDKLAFYESAITRFKSYELVDFLQIYSDLLAVGSNEQVSKGAEVLLGYSKSTSADFLKKIAATYALNNLYFKLMDSDKNKDQSNKSATKQANQLREDVLEILDIETDPVLLEYYYQFPIFTK